MKRSLIGCIFLKPFFGFGWIARPTPEGSYNDYYDIYDDYHDAYNDYCDIYDDYHDAYNDDSHRD